MNEGIPIVNIIINDELCSTSNIKNIFKIIFIINIKYNIFWCCYYAGISIEFIVCK